LYITIKEIKEQPQAIRILLRELEEKKDVLDSLLSDASSFLFMGCGTSYYLGLSGASLMNGCATAFAIPSGEVCVSPLRMPRVQPDVIVPISRSGETTETLRATEHLGRRVRGVRVVGVTCTEGSTLHGLSDVCIVSRGGAEDSVVMTKSFSSMLVALQYLSELKSGKKALVDFQSLSEESWKVIEECEEDMKEIGGRSDLKKFIFLGTGEYYGLAAEAMLKMKEMALSWSEVYHPLEFRHGPKSIVDGETLVTFLWPDRGIEEHKALLEEAESLGAKTLVIGTEGGLEGVEADYVVKIPSNSNPTNLVLYMPPVQLLGYYRAVSLGLNPDRPRNLGQVVKI